MNEFQVYIAAGILEASNYDHVVAMSYCVHGVAYLDKDVTSSD